MKKEVLGSIDDFNAIAAIWDEKPQRIHLARAVADAVAEHIPLNADMAALDFGCGTGLVTFHLLQQLHHVTAMDSAAQMLAVFAEKAAELRVDNVATESVCAEKPVIGCNRFDLIYSSMVLHHVVDLETAIAQLVAALKPGGYIALADLDSEDGDFHDNPRGVAHNGIDRHWLRNKFSVLGLTDIGCCTAHVITKSRNGINKDYPVFLVWGCLDG